MNIISFSFCFWWILLPSHLAMDQMDGGTSELKKKWIDSQVFNGKMWINLLWLFNLECGIIYWKTLNVMFKTASTIDFLFATNNWLLIQKSSAMMILSFIRFTSISFFRLSSRQRRSKKPRILSWTKQKAYFQLTFFRGPKPKPKPKWWWWWCSATQAKARKM